LSDIIDDNNFFNNFKWWKYHIFLTLIK
jgi:hypothetical protein